MYMDGFAAHLKLNQFLPPSSPPPPLIPPFCCIRNCHRLTQLCSGPSPIFSSPNFVFRNSPSATIANTTVRGRGGFRTRAGQSPYQVLGLSPSATPDDIKKAYRKLALKYHPDVNKEPGAQEKFMRIKHAYNTLLDSKSRRKYDQDGTSYAQRSSTARRSQDEEDFYGLADFFRDVQEEFRNWETSASSQGKPKSLWEELSEIGEEFVEFLEKELNITNSDDKADFSGEVSWKDKIGAQPAGSNTKNEGGKNSSIEDNIDEIEATLAQLKRDLGL